MSILVVACLGGMVLASYWAATCRSKLPAVANAETCCLAETASQPTPSPANGKPRSSSRQDSTTTATSAKTAKEAKGPLPEEHQPGAAATSIGVAPVAAVRPNPTVPEPPEPAAPAGLAADTGKTPQQIFEQRIMPIFQSPNPSSCTQCHLSGLDLKTYILPSHDKTFLSLRDQGLINLDRPGESKILKFIQKGAEDDNKGAALIHEKVRKLEYDAFAAWIIASCNDPKLRNAPKLTTAEANKEKEEFEAVVQAAAKSDALLAVFQKTIWAQKNRCAPCHMPGAKYQTEKMLVEKHGAAKMNWMSADGPEATMKQLLTSRLINPRQPEQSILLLKALNDIPALKALNEERHGGGIKMKNGDPGHQAFLSWVTEAAKVLNRKAHAPLPPANNALLPAIQDGSVFTAEDKVRAPASTFASAPGLPMLLSADGYLR